MLRTLLQQSFTIIFYENSTPYSNTLFHISPYYETYNTLLLLLHCTLVPRYKDWYQGTNLHSLLMEDSSRLVIGGIVEGDKVQLKLWVSRSTVDTFKHEIALDKATVYKGLLSEEADLAFQRDIVYRRKRRSSKQQTTRLQQNAREMYDLIELRDNIIEWMKSQSKIWPEGPTEHISQKHLTEAIREIKVVKDSRTLKKWIDRLFRAGLIERIGPIEYVFCDELNQSNEPIPVTLQTGGGA